MDIDPARLDAFLGDPKVPQADKDTVVKQLRGGGGSAAQGAFVGEVPSTEPGLGTMLLEGGGATVGGMLGGRLGRIGAGVGAGLGDVAGRALAERRMPTLKEAGGAFARGAGGEALGQGVSAVGGRVAKAVGLGGKLAPEAQAVKDAGQVLDVPLSAADITKSRGVAMVENFPTKFALGGGATERFRAGQLAKAEAATKKIISTVSSRDADPMTLGNMAQRDVGGAVKRWRQLRDTLFTQAETLAGDQPVIQTDTIRQQLAANPLRGLRPSTQKIVDAIEGGTDQITFTQARELEKELGRLGYPQGPVAGGNLPQGDARAAWESVHQALDDWMATPAGADVSPALAEAKQAYGAWKSSLDNGARKLVVGGWNSEVPPERVLERVFRPGAVSDTLDYKLAVSDDTYQASVQTWLDGLYQKAVSPDGTFSPSRFVRELSKYDKNGHLDAIVDPATAEQLGQLRTVLSSLGTAEKIAGNPSGTGQAVVSSGQMVGLSRASSLRDVISLLGLPYAAGHMTTSPGGIEALQHPLASLMGAFGRQVARGGGQAVAQRYGHRLLPPDALPGPR